MATILTITTNPQDFADGAYPRATLNTGKWHWQFTFTAANTAQANYGAFFAQATGGLWIATGGNFEMYDTADTLLVSHAFTCAPGATVDFTIDVPNLQATIAGGLTGNGTFSFSAGNGAFFQVGAIRAGGAAGVSGFALAGTFSNVDDTITGASGTAAITLGALSPAATGTVAVVGTAAQTLGVLKTLTSGVIDTTLGIFDIKLRSVAWFSGDQAPQHWFIRELVDEADRQGVLAATLGAMTGTGAGTVAVAGVAARTLGSLATTGAAGTVAIAGTANATLGAATLSAQGVFGVPVMGDATITLGALTGTAAGTVAIAGATAVTLGVLTAAGTGTTPLAGTLTKTLGAMTGAGAGAVAIAGALAATLGVMTAAGVGGSLPDLAVGASSSEQRINLDPPGTGTLTTPSTNIAVSSVANGTDTFTATAHGSDTADGPFRWTTSGTFPTGVDGTTDYYVINTGANTFKVATTAANAIAGTAVNITTDGTGTLTLVRAITTLTTGSVFVTGVARGVWSSSPNAPTDNEGNTYVAAAGSPRSYAGFAASQAGVYVDLTGSGGSGHTFSATWGDPGADSHGDEVTLFGLEIKGATLLQSSSWVERANGSGATITSASVTTTGPAILVAVIFGNGPTSQGHVFTFNDGFSKNAGASREGDISSQGYIQVSVATRYVQDPGTYTSSAQGTSSEGGQYFLLAFQAAPGAVGAAAITLGAVALTAAGTVVTTSINGVTNATLGTATSTAAGQVAVVGTSSATLGLATSTAAGTVALAGALAKTLGAIAIVAAGRVDVMGVESGQLGTLLGSGAGTVALAGATAATLGALTLLGTGTQGGPVTGDAAITLGSLIASSTGAVALTGTLSQALGALLLVASTSTEVTGTGSPNLGGLTGAGTAQVLIGGSAAATLGAVVSSGSGTVAYYAIAGDLAATLGAVAATAAGVAPVTGAAGITLGALTLSASTSSVVAGSAAITLGAMITVPPNHAEVQNLGVLTKTLGALTSASAGVVGTHGTAVIALGVLTATGAGTHPVLGAASVTLGLLRSTATGLGASASNGVLAKTLGALRTTTARGTVGRVNRSDYAEGWGLHRDLLDRAREEGDPTLVVNPLYRRRS